eukprot:scaffold603_cov404-Prasinococcus_capsulatus_cf.AAC.11
MVGIPFGDIAPGGIFMPVERIHRLARIMTRGCKMTKFSNMVVLPARTASRYLDRPRMKPGNGRIITFRIARLLL